MLDAKPGRGKPNNKDKLERQVKVAWSRNQQQDFQIEYPLVAMEITIVPGKYLQNSLMFHCYCSLPWNEHICWKPVRYSRSVDCNLL